MIRSKILTLCCIIVFEVVAQDHNEFFSTQLLDTVEIITDHWGVPHIYAQNEHDLFFAQGYYAAKDRLFQFEIWRRQATGTLAEILGERELARDIGARLFQFRGDIDQEMSHYHPRGKQIIASYVAGVNSYIDYVREHRDRLPLEFRLLNIVPEHWTPAVVVSRHQGLLGNIDAELMTVRAVSLIGARKVKELGWFHPREPDLEIDPLIRTQLLMKDVIAPYHAYRKPVRFAPQDIVGSEYKNTEDYHNLAQVDERSYQLYIKDDLNDIGSNNWVIDGSRTESGYPIMANDPHRRQSTPSLRYMAHLVAPGWDVIGGGEPEIPGISIGHNQYGAWGLTVYRTDAEDLYIYQLNPDDPHQYKYQGRWETMTVIGDTINVKGWKSPHIVDHLYTRHGPVTKIDTSNHVAYAMRCGWLEVGGSPYLASLRMNQAQNWEQFRAACNYSHIPGENMVWADKKGNIGWQAVGIAPIRKGWSGLIPVPGDGRYEWSGYLPIISKPSDLNPSNGIINTSNENVTPDAYEHWDAVSYQWSDPYRGDRVKEVLTNGRSQSMADMVALQTDYLSIPARQIVPLFRHITFDNDVVEHARHILLDWDYQMNGDAIAPAIYNELEKQIQKAIVVLKVPESARPYLRVPIKRVIEWLLAPDGDFGVHPLQGRDALLETSLSETVALLKDKLGSDIDQWKYGQSKYKHILLKHPMSNAVSGAIRNKINVGPAPRGGYGLTVNNTGSQDNQPSGASFRMIVDTGDWDQTLASNTPGQNGDPEHPHYRNLFDMWVRDQYFPLFYSKSKVESVISYKTILKPKVKAVPSSEVSN